jgi:soluble lytic murein transglycosylase-like protein
VKASPVHWLERLALLAAMLLLLVCLVLIAGEALAADGRVVIPERSAQYRIAVQRAAGARWGIEGDRVVARLAAQIHAESSWRPDARSPFAEGMAQFVPATAEWIAGICADVGPADPWDPHWSIRAATCFDHWLWRRAHAAASECDRWAFTLSAYNGGERWLWLEQRSAERNGLDRARWFDHVASQRARSPHAWRENRGYVRRILITLEPAYIRAGWPGTAACHA